MSKEIKTIGVLTSGGDAPGMNSVVRAVVRSAIANGIKVYGIRRGYNGLIHEDLFEMNLRTVSEIIEKGGTVLYTARCLEFKEEAGMQKAIETCKKYGIDGIVVIDGDGSFRGAADLSVRGIPCVAVPGTIDNDISCSDYTIGYDTALNCVTNLVDRIRDTAQSHERCSIVEVMGAGAGYLALISGISTGANCILVPEVETPYEQIVQRIDKSRKLGKTHFIIVVAEGVVDRYGSTHDLAKRIQNDTGIETKYTILGHVQRGGSPTVRDRLMGSQMGHYAVSLLLKGKSNRVVVYKDDKIVDFDVVEALKMKKEFPIDLYNMANEISI